MVVLRANDRSAYLLLHEGIAESVGGPLWETSIVSRNLSPLHQRTEKLATIPAGLSTQACENCELRISPHRPDPKRFSANDQVAITEGRFNEIAETTRSSELDFFRAVRRYAAAQQEKLRGAIASAIKEITGLH